MPDEVTPGELGRRLEAHEQRTTAEHRALDERITEVARRSVSDAVYQLDRAATAELARRLERDRVEGERKMREDVIKPLERRMDVQEAKPQMTFTNKIAVYGLLLVFISVVIAAWVATKGAA